MTAHSETRTEFVVRKLREAMPKNWPEIAEKSGVPPSTIYKIAYRDTKDPRSSTLDPLYDYFVAQQSLELPHATETKTAA